MHFLLHCWFYMSRKNKNQAFGKDKPTKATAFSALECCMLICEAVLMHKQLHNSSEVQH